MYLNSLFSYFLATTPPSEQGRITSHHASIDDMLIRSDDPSYMQRAINVFDGPARLWGLDMNVQKTDMEAMGRAVQRTFTTVVGSSFHTLDPKTSRPTITPITNTLGFTFSASAQRGSGRHDPV